MTTQDELRERYHLPPATAQDKLAETDPELAARVAAKLDLSRRFGLSLTFEQALAEEKGAPDHDNQ